MMMAQVCSLAGASHLSMSQNKLACIFNHEAISFIRLPGTVTCMLSSDVINWTCHLSVDKMHTKQLYTLTREGEVISTWCTMQLHIELVAHCVWYIAS